MCSDRWVKPLSSEALVGQVCKKTELNLLSAKSDGFMLNHRVCSKGSCNPIDDQAYLGRSTSTLASPPSRDTCSNRGSCSAASSCSSCTAACRSARYACRCKVVQTRAKLCRSFRFVQNREHFNPLAFKPPCSMAPKRPCHTSVPSARA